MFFFFKKVQDKWQICGSSLKCLVFVTELMRTVITSARDADVCNNPKMRLRLLFFLSRFYPDDYDGRKTLPPSFGERNVKKLKIIKYVL